MSRRGFVGLSIGSLATVAPFVSEASDVGDDVAYPEAVFAGEWVGERKITILEGDLAQAETAWRALGGDGRFGVLEKETFSTRFVAASTSRGLNLEKLPGWASSSTGQVVSDRAYEIQQRRKGASGAAWNGNSLSYSAGDPVRLECVSRRAEDIGRGQIGSSETFVARGGTPYAVTVQRSNMPAPLAEMFGGTEVIRTFPLLENGAIGPDPTSTVKSRLHFDRAKN